MLILFASIFPREASLATVVEIGDKQIEVVMRMIGHQVLTCMGDLSSRVVPIEQEEEQFKISFASAFVFDPEDIISITDRVMTEARISNSWLVQLRPSGSKEVVHSFWGGKDAPIELYPCTGRIQPGGCYDLFVSLLDRISVEEKVKTAMGGNSPVQTKRSYGKTSSSVSFLSFSEFLESSLGLPVFFTLIVLLMVGAIVLHTRKKNAKETNPNLIRIGASRFDKRNMALFIEKHKVELSHKETELLSLLQVSVNTPVEREIILRSVWGDDGDYLGRTLDVFISKLRKKLEADASIKIVNIRGIGYKLMTDITE